jgi:hypothetical protein
MRYLKHIILSVIIFTCSQTSNAQLKNNKAKLVELTGVVMSSDSLRYIPFVIVNNVSKSDGTVANSQGVFTLLLYTGDTIEFLAPGYGHKLYVLPKDLSEFRYSILQLLTQDTFYNDESILRPAPSREEFDYAFKTWNIPDDQLEIARRNTELNTLRALAETMPADAREATKNYINQQWQRTTWLGGTPPQHIFSPLAWADFIRSWKNGVYRKKKKKNG